MIRAENKNTHNFDMIKTQLTTDLNKKDESNDIDLIEHFRTFCTIMYESRTVEAYVGIVKHFSNILDLNEIDCSWDYLRFRPYLMEFLIDCKKEGNKPQTIGNKLTAIDRLFVFMKDRGLASENPVENFRKVNLKVYKNVAEHHQVVSKEKMEEIITVGTVQKKHWRTDEICIYKTLLLRNLMIFVAQSMPRREAVCRLNIGDFQ